MPRAKCDHSHGGKAWTPAQHARAEAQILPQRLDKRFPADRADDFLRNFGASSLQTHSSKRILAAHTLLHLFFGCHIQETTQFFVQLLADLLLSKQRSQSI